jgi:PEP-CTERM motif
MRTVFTGRTCAALFALCLASMLNPPPAHALKKALSDGVIDDFSWEMIALCAEFPELVLPCAVAVYDPPGEGVNHVGFTLQYDPSRVKVFPMPDSGFLCDFSENGDCPEPHPQIGTVRIPFGNLHLGDAKPGTSFIFNIDEITGTVFLDYDLSANPATGEGNRFFFGLAMAPLQTFDGTVTIFDTPGIYDIYFTQSICQSTIDGRPAFCRSDTPAFGMNFNTVPEPSTIGLLGAGLATIATRWRSRRTKCETRERTTPNFEAI